MQINPTIAEMRQSIALSLFLLFPAVPLWTQWCTPGIVTGSGNGITQVTFSSISRSSLPDEGYVNTGLTGTVLQAGNYPLTVTFVGSNAPGIWADWNQDGDFADAGEDLTGFLWYPTFSNTRTLPVTVPAGAALGFTRLRIWAKAFGTGPVPDPCTVGAAGGDVEDYTLEVVSGNMSFVSATTTQVFDCNEAFPAQVNRMVMRVEVHTLGSLSPIPVTAFQFHTGATTNAGDVVNAKVYFTGDSAAFRPVNLFGSTALPSGPFTVSGSQPLADGVNYFWLVYDVSPAASAGNLLDADCSALVCTGLQVPAVTSPAGNLIIQPAAASLPPGAPLDFSGTDFWFQIPAMNSCYRTVCITGDVTTSGVVSIPGIGFSQSYCFVGPGSAQVSLPPGFFFASVLNAVNRGIHVTADNEVTVSASVGSRFSADDFLLLPTHSLGMDYYVNIAPSPQWQEVYVTATENNTLVTLTNSVVIDGPLPAGSVTTYTLNQAQSMRIITLTGSLADMSGSRLQSDKPIAITSSSSMRLPQNVNYSDLAATALLPVSSWGTSFPLAPVKEEADSGFYVQIFSPTAGNQLSIDGVPLATLCAGELWKQFFPSAVWLQSTQPVSVTLHTTGEGIPVSTTDPAAVPAQPVSQFVNQFRDFSYAGYFKSCFPAGMEPYIDSALLIVPTAFTAAVTLNAAPVSAALFQPLGTSAYSYASVALPAGYFTIQCPAPMMAYQFSHPFGGGQGQMLRNLYFTQNPPNGNSCPVLEDSGILLQGSEREGAFHLSWQVKGEEMAAQFVQRYDVMEQTWRSLASTADLFYSFHPQDQMVFPHSFRIMAMTAAGGMRFSNVVQWSGAEDEFSFWPHPVISGGELSLRMPAEVEVLDLSGRVLARIPAGEGPVQRWTVNLPAGLYWLRCKMDSGVALALRVME